jgi:hypothetical protein
MSLSTNHRFLLVPVLLLVVSSTNAVPLTVLGSGPSSSGSSPEPTCVAHSLTSSSAYADFGPMALTEAFQATFFRILELGFWRGLLGSVAVVWILGGMALGMVMGVAVWLRRREEAMGGRKKDRERRRKERRDKVGSERGRGAGRRVRWLDEIDEWEVAEGGKEMEDRRERVLRLEVLGVELRNDERAVVDDIVGLQ